METNYSKIVLNEPIAEGTSSKVYEISNEKLLKLYKCSVKGPLLIEKIEEKDDSYFIKYLKDNNEVRIKTLKSLLLRQENIKLSKLPTNLAFYNEWLVGVYLYYFRHYRSLMQQIPFMNYIERKNALEQIREKLTELQNNYIYPMDGLLVNILIHPKTLDVEFIDLDDQLTPVYDEFNYDALEKSNNQFKQIIFEMKRCPRIKNKHTY